MKAGDLKIATLGYFSIENLGPAQLLAPPRTGNLSQISHNLLFSIESLSLGDFSSTFDFVVNDDDDDDDGNDNNDDKNDVPVVVSVCLNHITECDINENNKN